MDFVTELVRKRGKENFPKFIQFVVDIFKRYNEASLENKPYRLKDGALLAVGTLCDKLRQTEPYKSELENMLVQHVFPEFSSPAGHLRAKVLVTSFLMLKPPSCPFLLCKLYFYSLSFMHVLEDVLRFFSILPNACISL
jgi:hypothetical protein